MQVNLDVPSVGALSVAVEVKGEDCPHRVSGSGALCVSGASSQVCSFSFQG